MRHLVVNLCHKLIYLFLFLIDHVEVWGLGPQPRAEEERAKVQVRKPDLDIQDGNVDMDDLLGQIG